jgi:hypothetical protein
MANRPLNKTVYEPCPKCLQMNQPLPDPFDALVKKAGKQHRSQTDAKTIRELARETVQAERLKKEEGEKSKDFAQPSSSSSVDDKTQDADNTSPSNSHLSPTSPTTPTNNLIKVHPQTSSKRPSLLKNLWTHIRRPLPPSQDPKPSEPTTTPKTTSEEDWIEPQSTWSDSSDSDGEWKILRKKGSNKP